MSDPQANPELLARLVDEWQERLRKGEKPDLDEYTRRYPDLADEIRQLLPGLAALEDLKGEALDRTIAPSGGLSAGEGGLRLEQLGDYRILREVGRGGMGVVYEAEQVSLGRHVALKVLPQKLILDLRQKRRFEREAKAAAKLHHTNIVPVFGVGEYDGMPYYVMQFIQGLGLDAVMDEVKRMQGLANSGNGSPAFAPTVTRGDLSAADVARSLMTGNFHGEPSSDQPSDSDPETEPGATPPKAPSSGSSVISGTASTSSIHLPGVGSGHGRGKTRKQTYWESVAAIGAQVADALDYAHTQGILHRDIKPSNLLLDTRGTVWVTDFGLAKASDHNDDLTHTGDVLGTLRYMPPEAFEGASDARGDLYSLGLTLYEMLALKPAFAEKDRHRLVRQVTTAEPERLSRLNRAIPHDLVTVIHKAIDREPGRRYQSAREFADDLERFIANEPIQARRSGAFERTLRWVRRRPAAAALVGVSAIAAMALAATVIVLLYSRELERAKGEAERARADAEQARDAEAAQRRATESALTEAETQRGLAVAAREDAEKQREQAILQRGLLAVHTEQWPEAVTDLERYTRSHPDDFKAWLGLAKALGRSGQPQKSVESYTRAISRAPDNDIESRVEAHAGRAEQEAGRGRLNAAIADYEQAFQLKPDQAEHAPAFARTLYDHSAGWRVLEPLRAVATGSVTLKPQDDGSIVPEGNTTGSDMFTIIARTDLAGIRAIRLEVLPDRPRRTGTAQQPQAVYQAGQFVLSEFTVSAAAATGPDRPVVLNRAWSDYNYPGYYYSGANTGRPTRQASDINAAIDGDPQTGWSLLGQFSRSHTAVFLPAQPVGSPGGTQLTIQLRFGGNRQTISQNSIGRFRLSISSRLPTPAWECLMNNSTASGWSKLAGARLLRGEQAAAIDALGRADKQAGDPLTKQLLHSVIFDPVNQRAEARSAYEKAVQQLKGSTYTYSYGDMTHQWLIVETSSRWIELEPTVAQYRRNRADALVSLENWGEAIADYDELIARESGDNRLYLERGYCYSRRGVTDKALADFLAAGRLNAEDSLAWHRQKLQLLEYLDVFSSLPHLDACIALEKGRPGEAEFLVKRGRLQAQSGRKESATADFTRALEVNPNSADAILERGAARAEAGDLDGARTDFAAARKLGAAAAQHWHVQQLNRVEYGPSRNAELALLHLGELIELDTAPAARSNYLMRRIYVLRQLQRWNEAIADFDRMVDLNPRLAVYRVDRAICLVQAGQREKAIADLADSFRIDRAAALQQIRYRITGTETEKDWRQAELYLDACLRHKHPPNDELDLLRRRARVRVQLGQYTAALADCDRIFALSPDDLEGAHAKAAAYVSYARDLRLQGKADEARKVAGYARAFLKVRAASRPNDQRFAVELVNFLLTEAAGWQPLEITGMKSAGGATLTKQPDGSILASGTNPDNDSYSLTARAGAGLNTIRLDVLPDDSLPERGPGRSPAGNFYLTDIKVDVGSTKSPWRWAYATIVRPLDNATGPRDGPRGAIDGDPTTRWDVGQRPGLPHAAMFTTANPVGGPDAPNLNIRLEFQDPAYKQFTLGRFRLAGSASRYAVHCEQIIVYAGGHWAQMAVGYALLGEREDAEAALRKAEAVPAENDGGALLITAWAADLLGFADRARTARQKVLAWFATKTLGAAVPVPAVAIEVLSRVGDDEPNADVARRWLARSIDTMGDEETALAAFDRAIRRKSDDPGLFLSRGNLLLRQHKWKEALTDFQKIIELKPDEHFYYLISAPIFLLADDEDGYRQFRKKLLQRFVGTEDGMIAERMAKASLLVPGTRQEMETAVELTRRALASMKYSGFRHWFHLAHALASYRVGDFNTTVEHARLSRERDAMPPTKSLQTATRLLEALAQFHLGKTPEARRLLDQAEEIIGRDLPNSEKAVVESNFHDWVLCKLLQREAELAINPVVPPQERAPMPRELAVNATEPKK